jgi:hypothetical protein
MTSYGPVERATRAELRALELSVQTNAAAAAVVAVAKRLDATTGAASAAAAARELRLALAALRTGQSGGLEDMDPEVRELLESFARA